VLPNTFKVGDEVSISGATAADGDIDNADTFTVATVTALLNDYTITPFQLTTQDDIGWRVATITGRPVVQRLQTGSAEPRDSPRGRAACRR
jgi:hypothetical protein